jgi:cell division protease FtsH
VPPRNQAPQKPWRTEGLPPRQAEKPRLRRSTVAVWLVGYLLLFGMLTVQDRLAGPQPVPYTEFKNQVANKNVGALFARGNSIQGELKKAAALPEQQDRTYQQFSTERPTFATDDLITELTDGGATVRATLLVAQRGFLTNLLISFAPILLAPTPTIISMNSEALALKNGTFASPAGSWFAREPLVAFFQNHTTAG